MPAHESEYRIYPTTFGQAFRCASLAASTLPAKNEFTALRLRGAIDITTLRKALAWVVACHEAFRTDFPLIDGEYVQRVWPSAMLDVRYHDLQHQPESHREMTFLQERQAEIQTPFDMQRAPLARVLLFRTQPRELIVAITVEHLIIDALSMGVFWRDLFAAYTAHLNGTPPTAPTRLQFGDFAAWQRARLTERRIAKLQDYWRSTLTPLPPPIRWKCAPQRPPRFTYRSRAISTQIPASTAEALRSLVARTGTSLFAALNALFVLAIGKFGDSHDILLNTAVANRRRGDFDQVIGFFAQKVLIRLTTTAEAPIDELVRHCHQQALNAIAHCEINLGQMKAIVGDPVDASYAFRQQVSHLHYSFIRPASLEIPGLDAPPELVEPVERELPHNHDLVLYSIPSADGIELTLWYNTGLFEERAARELLDEIAAGATRCD